MTKKRKLKNVTQYELETFFSNYPVRVSIKNIRVDKDKPRTYSYDIWLNNDKVQFGLLHSAKNKVKFEKEVKKYIKDEYGIKKIKKYGK